MIGFDRNKIIGMSKKELDDLTCFICQGIIRDPVSSQCCRQTYCRTCIEEWLKNANTCPYGLHRKPMVITDLSPPPKFVVNLLNNMKIKCEYQEKGCDVITTIGELTKHLDECKHKLDKNCKTCGLLIDSAKEHSCIANLVIKNKRITDENKRLQNEVQSLRRQLNGTDNNVMDISNLIRSARLHRNHFVVENIKRISLRQRRVFTEICVQVILNNDTLYQMGLALINQLNDGESWNFFVYPVGCPSMVYSHRYFRIRFDEIIIEIFTPPNK